MDSAEVGSSNGLENRSNCKVNCSMQSGSAISKEKDLNFYFFIVLCNMKKYYLIYKITNLINNKIYIGQHVTYNINDDYMGSGIYLKHAIEKHGIENFKKEILFECNNQEELDKKEAELVNEEFVKRKDTYNLNLGGSSWYYVNKSGKAKSSEHWKLAHEKFLQLLNTDSVYKKEHYIKVSIGLKKAYQNPNKFKKHKAGEFKGKNATFYGRKHTKETKIQMSNSHKGLISGKNNPNYGKVWIYNLDLKISKSVKKEDLNLYLDQGWLKGRKQKWN